MSKKYVFLGTGGTIAGTAARVSDNVGYSAGQVGIDQLLLAMPMLALILEEDEFVSEQVAQVDSKDMGWDLCCALALRVRHYLDLAEVSAVVITHGTDTLEETAYFLSLALPAELLAAKPVVLTCAMRPASSLAPDGPQNVLDAVAVARSIVAHGVMAVCAGTIHSARDVQKVHPYRLDAFDSGDAGPLGYVEEGVVRWMHPCPQSSSNHSSAIACQGSAVIWPRVEIVMNYIGASGATVRALCAPTLGDTLPVRGIVVAGTGNGTIHNDLEAALREAQGQGVRVIRATRCLYGCVVPGSGDITGLPHSNGLSPVKARIALTLELLQQSETGLSIRLEPQKHGL